MCSTKLLNYLKALKIKSHRSSYLQEYGNQFHGKNDFTCTYAPSLSIGQAQSTPKVAKTSGKYSRKVFVGGLPPDIDQDEILNAFCVFGPVCVDWPHKTESNSAFPPKGYAFLIFRCESSVENLIAACTLEDDKYYYIVSSKSIKGKSVQIRPWRVSDADYILDPTVPFDPKMTIFVGGVPRPLKAIELALTLNRSFGGVSYAGIDVDPELKYPKGAGRVAFSNYQSYLTAISSRFVVLEVDDISKRVEIKPFVLDNQLCDQCHGNFNNYQPALYFCGSLKCLKYYCDKCWGYAHSSPGREFHKPLVKEGNERPRTATTWH